jgi:hypothetical protein
MGKLKNAIAQALQPWATAITSDHEFESLVLGWFIMLVLLRKVVLFLSARKKTHLWTELLQRPTVVPVMLHSLVTTVMAIAVILMSEGPPTMEAIPQIIELWRRGVLPFSSAYWLFDLAYYCYPKGDLLIAVHHVAILLCNYPIGDNAAYAALQLLNPRCNLVMCSATGYTLEATTFLLYGRWILANVLVRHHWIYSANNLLLLISCACPVAPPRTQKESRAFLSFLCEPHARTVSVKWAGPDLVSCPLPPTPAGSTYASYTPPTSSSTRLASHARSTRR